MRLFSFKSLIYFTFLLSLCVIALGAYTRLTEAGLGCPDWPGCYGFISVPQSAEQQLAAQQMFPSAPIEAEKAWNEMVHRYFAGSLGVFILLINVLAWRRKHTPKLLPALLLVTVIFQALLGMWTVTMALMPIVVMGHLLGGFITASLLLLLALRVRQQDRKSTTIFSSILHSPRSSSSYLKVFALGALFVVMGQIALGGWTAANYAAVACTQLPVCEGDWQGNFDPTAFEPIQPVHDSYQYGVLNYHQRVSIHVAHRIGAMVTTAIVILLIGFLMRTAGLRKYGFILTAALMVQVSLGVMNIVASLPLLVAVGHNVMGVVLLLSIVATNYRIYCGQQTLQGSHLFAREGRNHG